jgi:hypothetical protein
LVELWLSGEPLHLTVAQAEAIADGLAAKKARADKQLGTLGRTESRTNP